MFRIEGNQMRQVFFQGASFVSDLEPDITVTPDGVIWFAQNSHVAAWSSFVHLYFLAPDWALQEVSIDLSQLPYEQCCGIFSDSTSRVYALIYCYGQHRGARWFCRIHPETSYLFTAQYVRPPVFGSSQDAWLGAYTGPMDGAPASHTGIYRVSTESRQELAHYASADGIAVEAQVINNGPVVGVDVYVALELNGQLLFWPNWQPEPSPVQVNLCPGFNESATIIEMPKASIPPGSYTFWGCMTGRNTQKLIGPLDRKFEALTIQVD